MNDTTRSLNFRVFGSRCYITVEVNSKSIGFQDWILVILDDKRTITTAKFINATLIEEEPPISTWTDWWENSEVEDKVQIIAVINEEDPKVVDVSGLRLWKWKNE